jgi:hypothetical protein
MAELSRACTLRSPVMRPPSTRLLLTMPFGVPAYWTPEQALAVVELLDDLRRLIWAHYGAQLLNDIREEEGPDSPDKSKPMLDGPVF